ncbi:aldehyde ferredoxin oxidoreductase family protein [Methanofollis tationis]|uniref:Aldehyde ferredoxin oxidoreductase family protein n=1 Tax=Methanofollis tationis TaxID=81417 RepID=A0A7K4HNZ6_9EURY|nr:aldehyde ferredoxin oxidoreductase family protein [Methanofollis tationis]NVO66892.1 aldehyde ferredoxin oxidoreductase family protein [Methanofollis tationis]
MDGYAGKMAFVDLTGGKVTIQPTPADLKKNYLGGRGFGARIVSDRIDPGIDALSPENVIVFAAGPLTGTGIPLGARYEVTTKAPLNDTLLSANSGGVFGWKMKKAGFDAVIFTGRSLKPVYLFLNDGTAELRDASGYWGMRTSETTAALKRDLGDQKARVACIGPAGELKSRIACIINEDHRAAGRGGTGAVLGSKNLKAVVATGDLPIKPADEEQLNAVKERVRNKIEENGICQGLHKYGTAILINIINENGVLPTRNFQRGYFPQAEKISGETIADTILTKPKGCYACIVQCGRVTKTGGAEGEGPEYEPDWAFGADCGIDDLNAIARANYICNDLGLDAIGTPTSIACAMEMTEKGYLKEGLRFGDAEKMLRLVEDIGYRRGLGAELADGSFRFASKYGHPELSISVKKQELPAYDPRGLQGYGLATATSVRGGDHVYGYLISPEVLGAPEKLDPYISEGKDQWVKTFQDLTASIDASGMCLFTSFALGADDYADLIAATTGMSMTTPDLLLIGERIWNLQKLFNIKVGYTKADDTLPGRLLTEPLQDGAPKGRVWQRQPLLDNYYAARGWDNEGRPTPAKLKELGLTV